ncbi:hypothetical protein [Mucilaginibacter aquatilis]|uniref:Class I SAM-dependent methyltransferase n=1 Tax=Mucilaginibacter aquatilis TaxID=1517760 RepID=A0A6I4IG19_9SPHI|nr:hypothetical protein [Mucilaginibacter aquatilis]MVN92578.1 hypothetical protein [Mucilaginibacter aquatilis]
MFSFKFAISHFLHQRKAINRHGLHSPFVYRLVDEVIYDFSEKKVYADIQKKLPAGKKLNAVDKLVGRLAADAHPQSIWILGRHEAYKQALLSAFTQQLTLKSVDNAEDWKGTNLPNLVYLDFKTNPQSAVDYFLKVLNKIKPDTLVIADNINENQLAKAAWRTIQSHSKVTVTVNLFWLGLIYCRPGQVKEDFLIKF